VDFPLVLTNFFSLGVTAEVLRENIDRKLTFLKVVDQFHVGNVPREPFLH